MSETIAVVFIPLTQGKVAVIDFDDFEKVRPYKWCAAKSEHCWYAIMACRNQNIKRGTAMHRLVLNFPDAPDIDHINGNGLDNQKHNLRAGSHAQNLHGHRRKSPGVSSIFRGVSWCKQESVWRAYISKAGKNFHIGCFDTEEAAARAWDEKALELRGPLAALNFPNERGTLCAS